MCNLKKRLIRAAFWVLLQAMFMNDWKQTAQRLKLQERLLTINKRNIIRWNIYRSLQRQQFSFTKTSILKCKNSWVLKLKAYNKFMFQLSRLPGVCFFQIWTRGKKIAKSFLSTAKFITKYSSERLLSIYGEKIYLKAL